jgi:hypothetical protein
MEENVTNNIDTILAPFREYTPQKHKTVDYARLQELMDLIAGAEKAQKALKKEIKGVVAGMKKEVKSLTSKQDTLLRRAGIIPKKKRTKEEPKSDGDSRVKVFPTTVSAVAGKTTK